jgi:hypothetical protein
MVANAGDWETASAASSSSAATYVSVVTPRITRRSTRFVTSN